MKKNIFFLMMLAVVGFSLTSCDGDKDSEGKSRFTYYAVLEMNGDACMTTPVGAAFTDPGCTATMGGEDVTSKIQTTGSVNTNQLGFYKLNYVVVNEDGFSATASRTVAVVDPNNFASTYYSESQYGSRHYYNLPVSITVNGDGTYTIDDLSGGFYAYGRYPGYPYDFSLEAVIKLNADNTVELVECNGDNWYWGEPIEITSGTYDPATGKVTLVENFSGTPMYVTLTK
jgi:hypothetical protein